MTTLDEIRRTALKAIESPEFYIPTRYPWTYSADFIRSHPEILPDHLRPAGPLARADAARAVSLWAAELGLPGKEGEELKRIFADCYLIENHIPLDVAETERSRPLGDSLQRR